MLRALKSNHITLFFLLFLFSILPNSAEATIIEGTISLPLGQVAPANGITINVFAQDINKLHSGYTVISPYHVTIPEGQSSTSYIIGEANREDSLFRVSFSCDSSDYLNYGYYSSQGTVWNKSDATLLTGNNNYSNIGLTLITGKKITGIIALPNGQAAISENIRVDLYAKQINGVIIIHTKSILSPGATSASYTIRVPDEESATWQLKYSYRGCRFVQYGFYSDQGTTFHDNLATLLPGGQDLSEINMHLLAGKMISGTVSLPDGHVTPTEGIELQLSAIDSKKKYSVYCSALILDEDNSTLYHIVVPDDDNYSWRVSYFYTGQNYLQRGYYSPNATTWQYAKSNLLEGGTNYSNIDLTLLSGKTISGTITLPPGADTFQTDRQLHIRGFVKNSSTQFTAKRVTLLASTSSATYSLLLPDDPSLAWSIGYYYSGSEYIQHGYYSSLETTWHHDQATVLPGGENHANINLTILSGKTITGTLSLPTAQKPLNQSNYIAQIAAHSNRGKDIDSTSIRVNIIANQLSQSYSITVPDEELTSWRVNYDYWENGSSYITHPYPNSDFLRTGYFSSEGTQWSYNNATLLSGGKNHANINLTLIPLKFITGTLHLPNGAEALKNSLYTDIFAYSGDDYKHAVATGRATIQAHKSTGTYRLGVPDDNTATWRINYHYNGDDYVSIGYYTKNGTTWNYNQATLLEGENSFSNIDLTLLTGTTISGRVSLPENRLALFSNYDYQIEVFATDDTRHPVGYINAYIPRGTTSGLYSLQVPNVLSQSWRVNYSLLKTAWWESKNFVQTGYYALDDTTPFASGGQLLQGGQNSLNIDLTFLLKHPEPFPWNAFYHLFSIKKY